MDVRLGIDNLISTGISVMVHEEAGFKYISVKITGVHDYVLLDLGLNEARCLVEQLRNHISLADKETMAKVKRFVQETKPEIKFNRLDKKKIEKIREVRMVVYP